MENKKEEKVEDSDSVKILKNLKKAAIPMDALLLDEEMELGKLVKLTPGGVLLFNKKESDLAKLRVQGVPFATGKVVKTGDAYGLQIEEILSEKES